MFINLKAEQNWKNSIKKSIREYQKKLTKAEANFARSKEEKYYQEISEIKRVLSKLIESQKEYTECKSPAP